MAVTTTTIRIMDSESSVEWYTALSGHLNQGDIVSIVPTPGLIDAPITICQPSNTATKGRSNYYPFDELPQRRSVEFIHAKGTVGLGMVLWPNCQIDKFMEQGKPQDKWFAAIAPVQPLSNFTDKSVRDRIQAFGRRAYFPVPAYPPSLAEDHYVDLRHIWPVRYSLLAKRVIGLTEHAVRALHTHLFWFMTEARVTDGAECPHCHEKFQLDAVIPRRPPDAGEEPAVD